MSMNGELLVTAKLRIAKKARTEKRGNIFATMNARMKDSGMRLHPTKGYKPL